MLQKFKKISFLFSFIVTLVGLTVLFGWMMDISLLKSISPNWVSMKVNTAFCFLLSGITLILLNIEKKDPSIDNKIIIAKVLSIIIFLIGTISLLQSIFSFNAGVDEFFIYDDLNGIGTSKPGRMAPATALCFMLFGISFLFSEIKIFNYYLFQLFSLVAGSISFISFTGYLFETVQLQGISGFTLMAFHTSFCFLLIMFAILFSLPTQGLMKFISANSNGARFFRIMFPIYIFFIISLKWIQFKGEQVGIFENQFGDIFFLLIMIYIGVILLWKASISLSKSEESLKLSETKFREFFENAQTGMYRSKVDGSGFLDVNKKFLDIMGFSGEEMLTIPSRIIWTNPEDRRKMIKQLIEHDGLLVNYETKIRTKNGEEKDISASIRLFEDKGYLEGTIIDISLRKKMEHLLNETIVKLEQSNKELEQFAYIAAHDLQEPLRMISSYTQLLERRYKNQLDHDANEFIGFAVGGAIRMQKLLNDLLDFSRITTHGKNFEEVDTYLVLGNVFSNLQQLILDNTALITNDNLPKLKGDESQILRVFQNLIENAIKFKKKTELPKIHISCKEKNNFYEFSVKDNGIGIDLQYQDKIFTIFQRLHSIKDYPGTGIGLSICKRIVERHGGKIWFESEQNNGTIFYFTLNKQ